MRVWCGVPSGGSRGHSSWLSLQTKSSQMLLDLIFTNKPDRIRKIYNLITGLSDHNLTLVSRKLSKTRFKNQNSMKGKSMPFIAPKDMALIENEIKQINWHDTIGSMPCEPACADLMSTIKGIILKGTYYAKFTFACCLDINVCRQCVYTTTQ